MDAPTISDRVLALEEIVANEVLAGCDKTEEWTYTGERRCPTCGHSRDNIRQIVHRTLIAATKSINGW